MNAHAAFETFDRETVVMLIFPPDVRSYIEARAKLECVSPLTIIRERMREVAEFDRLAVDA